MPSLIIPFLVDQHCNVCSYFIPTPEIARIKIGKIVNKIYENVLKDFDPSPLASNNHMRYFNKKNIKIKTHSMEFLLKLYDSIKSNYPFVTYDISETSYTLTVENDHKKYIDMYQTINKKTCHFYDQMYQQPVNKIRSVLYTYLIVDTIKIIEDYYLLNLSNNNIFTDDILNDDLIDDPSDYSDYLRIVCD